MPNKNIRFLGGKPLIACTIEAAKKSKWVDRLIVSTDSQAIAAVAKVYGAEVPFIRPKKISQGRSKEIEFLDHALDWLKAHENYEPNLIVTLYPTSPFRKSQTIDRAIDALLRNPSADSLRSVRLCTEHPYKMWSKEGPWLKPFVAVKNKNTHTFSYQQLPTVYVQNASIYISKLQTIRRKRSPVGDKVLGFIMNELESFDINTPLDFTMAEYLLKEHSI